MSRIIVSTFVLTLALAGCTSVKKVWSKPGMTEDQWAIDSASCQSRARRLADDEMALRPDLSQSGGIDNMSSYNSLMRSHDTKRSRESLYRLCLNRKGYQLITPKPAPTTKA
jgi:hypothetical protein